MVYHSASLDKTVKVWDSASYAFELLKVIDQAR